MSLSLDVERVVFPLAGAFTISRGTRTESVVVECRLTAGGVTGRGECFPYARYDETVESVMAQIRSISLDQLDRASLARMLPAGAARNAVDCALWDLEAKQSGKRVWELAGLPEPGPELTVYTLGIDTPEAMREKAAANAHRPILKIKLGSAGDIDRLRAIREGAPDSRIVIDANEGWDAATYAEIAPVILDLGVEMVEQPLPASDDAALAGIARPLPVCADEACHDTATLPGLAGKYDMVNIKLDKTGGLTEALALRKAAIEAGYKVMVGCMVGSSLAMAPGVLVAQGVAVTDLDGPLLLAEDRPDGLRYDEAGVHPSTPALWG
ncbi:dipeptide epimerase [Rhodobacteraceae bacterium NNCM2]|nr:dipeptide epimerase [Coraliihabitans acroporae]